MPIQATCQQCGATLPVPDEYAGQSVRCGGCRGVVRVPQLAQPVAPIAPLAQRPTARPVAMPVARKVKAESKAEPKPEPPPLRKARKARDDEDTPAEIDVAEEPVKPKARPLAKKRRESILTVSAGKWLFCFLATGVVGLGVLAYAAWGQRKNDGTAIAADAAPGLRR